MDGHEKRLRLDEHGGCGRFAEQRRIHPARQQQLHSFRRRGGIFQLDVAGLQAVFGNEAMQHEIGHIILERQSERLAGKAFQGVQRLVFRNDIEQARGQHVQQPEAETAIMEIGGAAARHHHRPHGAGGNGGAHFIRCFPGFEEYSGCDILQEPALYRMGQHRGGRGRRAIKGERRFRLRDKRCGKCRHREPGKGRKSLTTGEMMGHGPDPCSRRKRPRCPHNRPCGPKRHQPGNDILQAGALCAGSNRAENRDYSPILSESASRRSREPS
ncbi:UNVERIFIED_ORG: hypothetical protein QE446_004844 [Rhizobium sp. SORGH_AS260]|nr:hypothetical protein [Rhizobium sp. SORGH_AS_0285]MDP9756920.1 hypothetical protein [Rhizobium sp. SORGH_AS_0260]MDR6083830.1 hypothetical protein [Agrobacterium sp. SORGH_AS_0440]